MGNGKSKSHRKLFAAIAVMAVVVVVVVAYMLCHTRSSCNVPLAYIEHIGGDQFALRIRKNDRVRTLAKWRSPGSVTYENIVGYDLPSRTWIISDDSNINLSVIKKGRLNALKLEGVRPYVYDLQLARGRLITAYDQDGTIVIGKFDLNGRLLSKHKLQLRPLGRLMRNRI